MEFNLGLVVETRRVIDTISKNIQFAKDIIKALHRYMRCDWGSLTDEDCEMNNSAIENNNDRILAKYPTCEGDIYIITESDRSTTTILFTNEY